MAEGKQPVSDRVRVASVVVGVLVVVGVFILVKSCGSDTVVRGHYFVDYAVLAPGGGPAAATIFASDPGNGDVQTVSNAELPWAKDYDVTDPDAADTRVTVNNTGGVPLTCRVLANNTVLVEQTVAPGAKGECAVLHF